MQEHEEQRCQAGEYKEFRDVIEKEEDAEKI